MNILSYVWHDLLKRPYKLAKTIDYGTGKPVLLIHGVGTSGKTWIPLTKQIDQSKWHLIAYDLLGFGISPKPHNSTYDVSAHADAILASLERTHKNKKVVIIGHSMGGLIASHIATIRPDLVEHLILYEPPLFADSPEFRSHYRRKKLYFALYNEVIKRPQAIFGYNRLLARFAKSKMLTFDESTWYAFERSMRNTIMNQKAYSELRSISIPTEIIYGKFDFMVTRADVRKMLEANPCITFHLVNEMHEINVRAAKYIVKLLNPLY